MLVESTVRPSDTEVERVGEAAEIILRENIQEEQREDGVFYVYEEHRITVPWRDTLAESVARYRADWLERARKDEDGFAATIARTQRDTLLSASDWTQVADSPLTDEQRAAWKAYRQALRDVPQQDCFPFDVAWPVMPS